MTVDIIEFLEHHGVRGQKWGIRRDRRTGVRPIARTLNDSAFGRLANANAQRYMNKQTARAIKHPKIKLDETPWSNYKKSDYTVDQWHRASLIHDHSSELPTSKEQCKLPIKTPSGAVNRGGMAAAAAALAGARGGVHTSDKQRRKAELSLASVYSQAGIKPPPHLIKHSDIEEVVDDFLAHYGIRGMKWGIRHPEVHKSRPHSVDSKRIEELKKRPLTSLTNKQLKALNDRLNMEQQYNRLNPNKAKRGREHLKEVIATLGIGVSLYNLVTSPLGKHLIDLGKKGLPHK